MQPQLIGNDTRNEWKSSFLQRQERPGYECECVCVCVTHGAEVFGLTLSQFQVLIRIRHKRKGQQSVFIQFPKKSKKRLPPCPLQVCRNPAEPTIERRADVGISTPITSELGWERLSDLSNRSLKWLSVHRAATCNEPSRLFFLIFHPDNHKHTRVWMSSSVLSSARPIAFSVYRHRWQIRDIHIYIDHFCCRPTHMQIPEISVTAIIMLSRDYLKVFEQNKTMKNT